MSQKAKAFVIQIRDKDVSGAAKKADLVPIFEGKVRTFFPGDIFAEIQKAMSHYDPKRDYILPVGSSLANFVAGVAVGLKSPGQVKLMVYAGNEEYKEVVLKLEG